MTKPLIELCDVVVSYGRRAPVIAAGPCSLQVHSGEIVALVGESGSGKSTLARVAAGLLPPTSGSVRIRDTLPGSQPRPAARALWRSVQMIFQDPDASLNPFHRVRDAIREPMIVRGELDRAAMDARVAALMDRLSLVPDLAGRLPRELSGGQKQRVAIARAIAMEPAVLIADEALSALDVVNQLALASLFAAWRQDGIGLLMISHDLGMVRRLADRVIVLRAGHIVEEGDVGAVLTDPQHPYTRSLVEATPDLSRGGIDLDGVDIVTAPEHLELGAHR